MKKRAAVKKQMPLRSFSADVYRAVFNPPPMPTFPADLRTLADEALARIAADDEVLAWC
ncbi:hypothetical protein [Streptomyces sp. NPDC058385]|uniref:hypothetical protein n=1 Tax=Streptomyces sp. NPDC058385 TaxID=3346473 RepID=UPI00365E65F7